MNAEYARIDGAEAAGRAVSSRLMCAACCSEKKINFDSQDVLEDFGSIAAHVSQQSESVALLRNAHPLLTSAVLGNVSGI